MEKYILARSEGRAVRFTGELLARSRTTPNNACSNYSGSTGRWTECELYRTARGKYVCWRMEGTQWQGERNHTTITVVDSTEGVFDFFGGSPLAQELYEAAGLDYSEEVE